MEDDDGDGDSGSRWMFKYTSVKTITKLAVYVYKFNKKLRFVYMDRAFQQEIMTKSHSKAAISNRRNFRGE